MREGAGVKIKKFSELYKSKVKAICDQVGDEFIVASKGMLDKVARNSRVFASLDETPRSWLYAGGICLDIANEDKNTRNLVDDK